MATPHRRSSYQGVYVIGPALAYGSYIVLLIVALVKQHLGSFPISFMFLSFWGIMIFFLTVLLACTGFVHQKEWRRALLVMNVAVSLVIVVVVMTLTLVIHKGQPKSYACDDYVRCVIN